MADTNLTPDEIADHRAFLAKITAALIDELVRATLAYKQFDSIGNNRARIVAREALDGAFLRLRAESERLNELVIETDDEICRAESALRLAAATRERETPFMPDDALGDVIDLMDALKTSLEKSKETNRAE